GLIPTRPATRARGPVPPRSPSVRPIRLPFRPIRPLVARAVGPVGPPIVRTVGPALSRALVSGLKGGPEDVVLFRASGWGGRGHGIRALIPPAIPSGEDRRSRDLELLGPAILVASFRRA